MKEQHHPVKEKQLEVADIFRQYGDEFRRNMPATVDQLKVMHHIETCRTAALGGHVEQCDNCDYQQNGFFRIKRTCYGSSVN